MMPNKPQPTNDGRY